ncbi:hypothetical protein [Salinimicrobium sp. HB62]|nr:hypothetical protein [Salinimicrobium sp. HB62]
MSFFKGFSALSFNTAAREQKLPPLENQLYPTDYKHVNHLA